MIFLDTSALVRRFLTDEGPDPIAGKAREGERIILSDLARLEFRSAVSRRRRGGRLSLSQADSLLEEFRIKCPLYDWVPLDHSILDRAGPLVDQHALRSLDAIQLAAAMTAAACSPEPLLFGCLDAHLCAAAAAEGLEVLRA